MPAVLDGVRRLPGRAVQLPVLAVGSALSRLDAARREYDDLAQRGERLIARLRGTSFDELEDRLEDSLQGTPLARPYDAVEDALEDAGEAVAGTVSQLSARAAQRTARVTDKAERTTAKATDKAAGKAGKVADKAEKATDKAIGKVEKTTAKAPAEVDEAAARVQKAAAKVAEKAEKAEKAGVAGAAKAAKSADKAAKSAEKAAGTTEKAAGKAGQPKGTPTPAATQPDMTRIDTAATPEVVQAVEQASAQAAAPAVVDHDDLPLPDYDHMTLGALRGRLRSLDVDQLVQVRTYEKAHADRLPVVTMLDNRIAKLAAAPDDEQPSGVASDRPAPGQGDTPSGSPVTPATGGPTLNPPSQGVPTNPAQPRTTGSPGTNPSSNA